MTKLNSSLSWLTIGSALSLSCASVLGLCFGSSETVSEEKGASIEQVDLKEPKLSEIQQLKLDFNSAKEKLNGDFEEQIKGQDRLVDTVLDKFLEKVKKNGNIVPKENVDRLTSAVNEQRRKFKEINRRALEKKRDFLTRFIIEPIEDKIKSWENDPPKEKKYLFTDGQMDYIKRAHEKVVKGIVETRRKANLEALSAITSATINGDILRFAIKQTKYKMSNRVKKILRDSIRGGFTMFDPDHMKNRAPSKQTVDKIVNMLENSSEKLMEAARTAKKEIEDLFADKTYQTCNHPIFAALVYLGSVGFCAGYTIGVNISAALNEQPVDIWGLGNVFNFVLSLISMMSAKEVASVAFKMSYALNNRLYGLVEKIEISEAENKVFNFWNFTLEDK